MYTFENRNETFCWQFTKHIPIYINIFFKRKFLYGLFKRNMVSILMGKSKKPNKNAISTLHKDHFHKLKFCFENENLAKKKKKYLNIPNFLN